MRRSLQYANLFGVIALVVVCLLQWQADRRLNLELRRYDQQRNDQAVKIQGLENNLNGLNEDLTQFKGSLTDEHAARLAAEQKLRTTEHDRAQLAQESAQLRGAVSNWVNAVSIRDERLKTANERIQEQGDKLNASILRFN